jgi:uncharacterized cupredoxin-like copper-binding protein
MSKLARACALVFAGMALIGCASPRPTPTSVPTGTATLSPAVTMAASPVPSVAAGSPAASGAMATVTLEARDLSFAPKALEVAADRPFELTMHNAGVIAHNVTIDAPGVQLVVVQGRTGSVVVEGMAPGTYPFYCSVSGHRTAGMEGTLTVR